MLGRIAVDVHEGQALCQRHAGSMPDSTDTYWVPRSASGTWREGSGVHATPRAWREEREKVGKRQPRTAKFVW